MRIIPVPCRSDNYAYIVIDQASNKAAVVDPYDVPKVISAASEAGVEIVGALTTHHHDDHSGGNKVRRPFNFDYVTEGIETGISNCLIVSVETGHSRFVRCDKSQVCQYMADRSESRRSLIL